MNACLNVCSNPVGLSPVFGCVTLRLHLKGKVKQDEGVVLGLEQSPRYVTLECLHDNLLEGLP